MTHEQILQRIAELHLAVRTAEIRRHQVLRSGAPWDAVREARKAESLAVNERDLMLNAALVHLRGWAHDLTDCPICAVMSATD